MDPAAGATRQHPADRAGAIALAALAPASLLAVDPTGWYPFGPAKWLAALPLGFAGSALVLARRPARLPRGLAIALVALVAAMAVAAAVGLDPVYGWTGTPERRFGVVTWALCALTLAAGSALAPQRLDGAGDGPDRRSRRAGPLAVVAGLVLAGCALGAVATAEALGWEPGVLDVGDRLTATLGSSAYLGAATALLLPTVAAAALEPRLARAWRALAAMAVPLLVVASVGSGARAAWSGLTLAAAVTAWTHRHQLVARRRAAATGAGAAVVAVALVLALSPAGDRLASLTDSAAPGGRGRLDEWRVATRAALDHPLTGVGPEGYRIAFGAAVDERYEREHGRREQPDRAHSGPLDVALAGGIPALAAWAAVVVLVGRRVLGALRHGPVWAAGLAAGLVAHLGGQLALFPLAELEPVAWLAAGLVVGLPPPGRTPDHPARVVPRPVVALAALLAVVTLLSGVTEVRADRLAARAADALGRGDHRAAVAAATDAADLRPDVVRLHLLAATARVAAEEGILAGIRQLDRALDVAPHDPIVRLARLRLLVDRAAATGVPAHLETARRELAELQRDDPSSAALWREAARVAALAGDDAAAREALERADALTPPREPEP